MLTPSPSTHLLSGEQAQDMYTQVKVSTDDGHGSLGESLVAAALGADGGGGRGSPDPESVGMRRVGEQLAAAEAFTMTS